LFEGKARDQVVSVEVGYGTTTVVFSSSSSYCNSITYPSVNQSFELAGGLLKSGKDTRNVVVTIENDQYEVGPNVDIATPTLSHRNLNDSYISSEQYRALLIGALMLQPNSDIDFLALGLPVNRTNLQDKLISTIE